MFSRCPLASIVSLLSDPLFFSTFFQDFLLVFDFQHFYYDVSICRSLHLSLEYIEFPGCVGYWLVGGLVFNKYEKFFAILQILFFSPLWYFQFKDYKD